jgi:hypothetical protein
MSQLTYVLNKRFDGTYSIGFINGPQQIDNYFVFETPEISGISTITDFSDDVVGETETTYFKKYFKYKNGAEWSEMLPIEDITTTIFNSCESLILKIYYYKTIESADGNNTLLTVDNILISGEYYLTTYDSEAVLEHQNDTVLLNPNDIYKIFSLSGYEVISNHDNYTIKYRFTQDDNRTYTNWEPLTEDNIKTLKLNPLRFAKVQYSITNNSVSPLVVFDIILEGDFQNVSANYLKINRYGLKEDCLTSLNESINSDGQLVSSDLNRDFYTSCLGTYMLSTDVNLTTAAENSANSSNLWNPYQFDKITSFGNLLANGINYIFGWTVDYHISEPDANGIDKYLNEYTLKNIVNVKKIKILVPDNKFPVESLIINQFNLDLFDVFEIHILKDEFKKAFGIHKRPSEDDVVYICVANMLYYVKHAQAYKDIMNSSIYYKVILEKYEFKANIRNLNTESNNSIKALTDNTTINELFGDDITSDNNKIANKEQTKPTTIDYIRLKKSSNVNIIDYELIVENVPIIKQYYDLSSLVVRNKSAVDYSKVDNELKLSDDRTIFAWFNINNKYSENKTPNQEMFNGYNVTNSGNYRYNILYNYNKTLKTGYDIYYQNTYLYFKINETVYRTKYDYLLTNLWYCIVIKLDQRQQLLTMNLYGLDDTIMVELINNNINDSSSYMRKDSAEKDSVAYNDLLSEGYLPVNNYQSTDVEQFVVLKTESFSHIPHEYTNDNKLKLIGSDLKLTNIRILDAVVDNVENIMKQYIIVDEQHLILGDVAINKLQATQFINKNWR